MDLKHLTFLVLAYTVLGTVLSFVAIKPNAVGRRYFLYHGLGAVALGLAALVFLGGNLPARGVWSFATFLVLSAIYCVSVGRSSFLAPVTFGASVVLAAVTLYIECLSRYSIEAALVSPLAGFVINAVLSSLLLGFTLNAMLLGHWYLVQPKLSIDELKRVTLCLMVLAALRFLVGTFFSYKLLALDPGGDAFRYLIATTPGLFTLMRWAWGLFFPLILLGLVWGTVRIRSTQSATGILYVAVLAVITGEILGVYLTLSQGVPL